MRNKFIVALIAYLLLSLIYTFPLVLKINSSTYGYSGDNFGAIHYFWWWKEAKTAGVDVRQSYLEEAPFGVTIDREPGTILFYLPVKILTLIFNEVISYNSVLILSFPATALSMFFLVNFLTGNFFISFLAGFIFSFSPYHLWKAYNHLDLSLIWTLPLFLLSLAFLDRRLESKEKFKALIFPSLFLSGSFASTILTNFYYGYFLLLLWGVHILSRVVSGLLFERQFYLTKRRIIVFALSALLTVIMVAPFTARVFLDSRSSESSESFLRRDSYHRPLLNLVSLSARPWDYLLPSSDHPLWGGLVNSVYKWIKGNGADFKRISAPVHERTIYLGIINIVSVLLSFFLLTKKDFRRKYGLFIVSNLLALLVLFLISLSPYIFIKGLTIYFPSFILYKFFPMFRTYSRLGVVILMLSTIISAAVLKYLVSFFPRRKILFLTSYSLLLMLAFFDFLNFPPFKTVDLSTPPSYKWLAGQPGDFSIVEYPRDFNVAESLLFQRVHGKGVLNFHAQSNYFNLWGYFEDFIDQHSSKVLDALGVKYAVFHKKLLFPEVNPVDDIWYKRAFQSLPYYKGGFPGFELVADFPESAIFEIKNNDPVYLVVLSGEPGRVKVDTFPRAAPTSLNHIYIVNLVDSSEELQFSFTQGSPKEVTLEGTPLSLSAGTFDLTLKNKFTDLTLVKSLGVENLGNLTVKVNSR